MVKTIIFKSPAAVAAPKLNALAANNILYRKYIL